MDGKDEQLLSPDRVGEVQDLRPQTSGNTLLTPETKVLCINRGREVLHDTFDSRHYAIEPGYFSTEYGAAKHFQARAVVPGSRNPETAFQASFIAIVGVVVPSSDGFRVVRKVDDEVQWDPFTDAECREYGHAIEALDREAMVDPIDPAVDLKSLHGSRVPADKGGSRVKGGGDGRAKRATQIAGDGADALKTKNKPGENDATRAIREARGRAGQPDPDEGEDA